MADEILCSFSLTVRGDAARSAAEETAEGAECVVLEGTVEGEAIAGAIRGTLWARSREDGAKQLTLHGLVTTGDGKSLVLTAEGRESADGRLVLVPAFEAADPDHRPLNLVLCIAVGRREPATGKLAFDVRAIAN